MGAIAGSTGGRGRSVAISEDGAEEGVTAAGTVGTAVMRVGGASEVGGVAVSERTGVGAATAAGGVDRLGGGASDGVGCGFEPVPASATAASRTARPMTAAAQT